MQTDISDSEDAVLVTAESEKSPSVQPEAGAMPPDCPPDQREANDADMDLIWRGDEPPGPQTHALSKVLAATGKIFRTLLGELFWLELGCKIRKLCEPVELEGFNREHLRIGVMEGGRIKGFSIPSSDLRVLMKTPCLQREIPVVDHVTDVVTYNSNWKITRPGYNDGPEGERYFYTGSPVEPKRDPTRIRQFLGAMSFKEVKADATNAVGLALTVLLRHMFPGGKPFAVVTANRSHAGKDTVLDFAAGRTRRVETSWSKADWDVNNQIVEALADTGTGFVTLGNVRVGDGVISSSVVERIVTDAEPKLQSSKRRGGGHVRKGDFVIGCSANQGRFSTDLMNRALPVCLELKGDIEKRETPLGDLRHEFLPKHMAEIEAELCGMIENWKDQGCLPDETVKHPMQRWAAVIGGILRANGFDGFLSNWTIQRSAQDNQSEALAILAHGAQSAESQWMRVARIVKIATDIGVIDDLIGCKHKKNEAVMVRDLGSLLNAYTDQTVHLETDDGILSYRISQRTARIGGKMPAKHYMFKPVNLKQAAEKS